MDSKKFAELLGRVRAIVRATFGRQSDWDEVDSAAGLGIARACDKFDAGRGDFDPYAVRCGVNAVKEYLRVSSRRRKHEKNFTDLGLTNDEQGATTG